MVRTHPSLSCGSRRRRLWELLVLACLGILTAQAQQRGVVPEQDPSDMSGAPGNYYALVIGINQYPAPMPQLRTAVNDARAMVKVLTDRYGFQVTLLVDGQATRANILNAIVKYRTILNENDSLLIYYGGHGYYDHDADKAYWLPADADSGFSANRIIADDLTSDLKALPSRHILVISDSCYSGGLSRDANEPLPLPSTPSYVRRQSRIKSRNLMSSGGNEPVADNGPDGHSVFASAILKGLGREDNDPQFAATDLFYGSVRRQVAANSEQIPEYIVLRNSSDDGGDFVFTRKGAPATTARSAAASPVATRSPPASSAARSVEPAPSEAEGAASATQAAMTPLEASTQGRALLEAGQFAEALPLLTLACNGGRGGGCGNLGVMYQNGNGVAKDPAQAVALYRKACDGGALAACNNLGGMYDDGSGVAQDPAQAVALYRKACDGGEPTACNNLGVMYDDGSGVAKDPAQAVSLYRKGCDGGEPTACNNLGVMYANGNGVAQDPAQAVALYSKGCDGGEPTACNNLGKIYDDGKGVPKDPGKAAALYGKACEGGLPAGCTNFGWMYENGSGVAKDPAQAVALYRKACDGGEPTGCNNLGGMYKTGDGVARDKQKAAALYRQACSAGLDLGCQNLKGLHP
jgi:hypothetical protein